MRYRLFALIGVIVMVSCTKTEPVPETMLKPQDARPVFLALVGDIAEDLTGDREGYYDWKEGRPGTQNFDFWDCDGYFGYGREFGRTYAIDVETDTGLDLYRRVVELLDGRDGWNIGWGDNDNAANQTWQTQFVHDDIGGLLISRIPLRPNESPEQIKFNVVSHCYPDDPVTGQPVVTGLNAG